ncbi:MAG TPA: hypothetical protein VKE70_07825, partial [Candidatus Solibacter sp.]|nr:hypothetical protein [Candidatus Solibacter sp.]
MKAAALAFALTSVISAQPRRPVATHRAAAFDMSPPLEQFIPDKKVVIHAAVVSKAETAGEMKGPALGQTPPAPPPAARGGAGGAGRAGRGRGGTPPPIPPPPPAAEIKAAGAEVEQTVQGKKPEIPLGVHFDGLGEGFTQRVLPGVES